MGTWPWAPADSTLRAQPAGRLGEMARLMDTWCGHPWDIDLLVGCNGEVAQ